MVSAGLLLQADDLSTAKIILESLVERSILHPELGRYWKGLSGSDWTTSDLMTQSAIIRFMASLGAPVEQIQSCIQWLLKHKQTNHWSSGANTLSAIQAIWRSTESLPVSAVPLQIRVGNWNAQSTLRGRQQWEPAAVSLKMEKVEATNPGQQVAWGSIFVQSLQPIASVQAQKQEGIQLQRIIARLDGDQVIPIEDSEQVAKGTHLRIRLILKTDRHLDYVYIKDLRGAGLEPVNQHSGYQWKPGLSYYQVVRDESQGYYLDHLQPGTHILEFDAYVSQYGKFDGGYAVLQCQYAPAFSSRSAGIQLQLSPAQ